jgi:phosphatidylserine/phosphatidylglycerophosphate/cardiolipin synthase-like enzyme
MDLITYLHFAGAQVKYYASTTFTHSKYISIDGTEAAISSVNFSKTSILKNREAGMIIANDTSGELIKFTESIFEYDFENGQDFHPQQRYAQADLDIIKDKTPLNVNVSQHYHFHYCNTESPKPVRHQSDVNIRLIASPDYAFESVMSVLNQTKKSLLLSIYEITHPSFADVLIALKSKGVELKLFVSNDIFAEKDKEAAAKVYTQLYNHGIHVIQSHKSCLTYSHQKVFDLKL